MLEKFKPTHDRLAAWLHARPIRGGTVTITNLYPYTTAPTAAQQHYTPHNKVIATVAAGAAGDTQAFVTHGFALTNSEITQGFPSTVVLTPQDGNAITSPWFLQSSAPNFLVLGKGATAAGGTIRAYLEGRPTS